LSNPTSQVPKPKSQAGAAFGRPLVIAALLIVVQASVDTASWTASITDIRHAATLIPGRRPLRIGIQKFAESRRTKNFSVKGAPTEPSVQARTAFQVVYPDGTVMVDAGMDRQVHAFFGRGVEEPYDAAAAARVQRAVDRARLIVVTHEHGDHVAGVIRAANASDLATKTILTRTQIDGLMTRPQMPEIKLSADLAQRFIVIDYNDYYPVAPGMVLIKAAGHTPGSQLVYVVLESGREYLLIGDAAWHMDGVRQIKGKDAPWITEDEPAVLDQLRWLNQLSMAERNIVIVASHDDEQHKDLVRRGLLGVLE
jgi:glyoxylase-like metal-dependent hydrolase (beta-lactamase superfamily II)